jgi:hypothetical protein
MLVVVVLTVGAVGYIRERESTQEITCYCPNAVQEVSVQILLSPGYSLG